MSLASKGAEATPPSVTLSRVDTPIVLDGKADESVWEQAPQLGPFSVYEPRIDVAPRFSAQARIVFSADAMYAYFEVDLRGKPIYAPLNKRDSIGRVDRIEIQLDPTGTSRRAYSFIVSASGILHDATINAERNRDGAWDSLFDAQTKRTKTGWAAEIRIPFSSLQFDPNSMQWRAHLYAHSWHHQQALSWAPIDRNIPNPLLLTGRLKGLSSLKPGRAIELLPSLTAQWSKTADDGTPGCGFGAGFGGFEVCGAQLEYGMGFKWAISPTLRLEAVANPDFSQIEADAPQLMVNNRFALFLQERRPFFLAGKNLFSKKLFYSRSIGQPRVAAKLLNDGGRVRSILITAFDDAPPDSVLDDEFSPSEVEGRSDVSVMTTVGRVEADLGRKGTVGAVAIDREYIDSDGRAAYNQVIGVDGAAHLTKVLRAETSYLFSNAASLKSTRLKGHNARARLVAQEREYRVQGEYGMSTPDFRNESGFIQRTDFHYVFSKIDFYYDSENPWARHLSPGIWAYGFMDINGQPTDRNMGVNNFWEFGHHQWIFTKYDRVAEFIDDRWLDGNTYKFATGGQPLEALSYKLRVEFGDEVIRDEELLDGRAPYQGWKTSPHASMTLRPTSYFDVSTEYEHRLLYEKHDGPRLASEPIIRSVLNYFFTRDLSARYIVEWTGGNDTLVNDALFRYEPSPGTVFFLRYREQTLLKPKPTVDIRSIFLKLSILFSA